MNKNLFYAFILSIPTLITADLRVIRLGRRRPLARPTSTRTQEINRLESTNDYDRAKLHELRKEQREIEDRIAYLQREIDHRENKIQDLKKTAKKIIIIKRRNQ